MSCCRIVYDDLFCPIYREKHISDLSKAVGNGGMALSKITWRYVCSFRKIIKYQQYSLQAAEIWPQQKNRWCQRKISNHLEDKNCGVMCINEYELKRKSFSIVFNCIANRDCGGTWLKAQFLLWPGLKHCTSVTWFKELSLRWRDVKQWPSIKLCAVIWCRAFAQWPGLKFCAVIWFKVLAKQWSSLKLCALI